MHDDHPEGGVPGPQLPQPLAHDSGGAHNDAGLEHAAAVQACQEGCQLYGLTQPHLVADDASCPLSVQLPQPLDPCEGCSLIHVEKQGESMCIDGELVFLVRALITCKEYEKGLCVLVVFSHLQAPKSEGAPEPSQRPRQVTWHRVYVTCTALGSIVHGCRCLNMALRSLLAVASEWNALHSWLLTADIIIEA